MFIEGSYNSKDFQELRRRSSSSRHASESGWVKGSASGELDPVPSDFESACSRARVGFGIDDDPVVSGSPPVRSVSTVSFDNDSYLHVP